MYNLGLEMLSHRHEIFMEVARVLSFTKASQNLYISQSAISRHIKALEEHYYTGLFDRSTNGIVLTSAGEALYSKLKEAKQLQHELLQELQALNNAHAPEVRMVLGSSTTISLYVLPPVMSAYLKENPQVQLLLKNRNSENILKALLDHEIDLGIVERFNTINQVTYTPFIADDVIAVCSPKNPLKKELLEVEDLRNIPLALRERGSGTLAVLEEALLAKNIKPNELPIKIRLGGTEALKNFVRVDDCLSFLPRQAVKKELESGELVEVPIVDFQVRRTFNFIQRKGTENNYPCKDFIQFTRRQFGL